MAAFLGLLTGGATLSNYVNNLYYPQQGFHRAAQGKALQIVQPLPGDADPARPQAMSHDGSVMVGFSGNPFLSFKPGPFIGTRRFGAAQAAASAD